MTMTKDMLKVVQQVHELFKRGRLTLSLAESCTGGLISHYLTALPGASEFFEAGLVTYSAESKRKALGISFELIERCGVVSEETAKEMAEKARLLFKTDFGLSTTGNLGPDVLEGKERGLVYIAVSKEDRIISKELRLGGDRVENKEQASFFALKLLIETIEI